MLTHQAPTLCRHTETERCVITISDALRGPFSALGVAANVTLLKALDAPWANKAGPTTDPGRTVSLPIVTDYPASHLLRGAKIEGETRTSITNGPSR